MYSQSLQNHIQELSHISGVDKQSITLLEDALACFVGILGRRLDAKADPYADLLQLTIRLLLISEGLAQLNTEVERDIDGLHYLIGMGFEQTGALLARLSSNEGRTAIDDPMSDDHWYRLTLALLHYLAGGYRVQAWTVLKQLEKIATFFDDEVNYFRWDYQTLSTLYNGRSPENLVGKLKGWLFEEQQPIDPQGFHIHLLAKQIRLRRNIVLKNLGQDSEGQWLLQHGVNSGSIQFWSDYLDRLDTRGITTFSKEQAGENNNFDWLQANSDLLVILPTGSGKTIIGELRSALTLVQNKQVIWLLPTRALVRQTTKTLKRAFRQLNISVEELPTTEDFIPLFIDDLGEQKQIAVTTPERLVALVRANPKAVERIGLVILDEAQILLKEGRSTTAEFALQRIRKLNPVCNFVLMTAFGELETPLEQFIEDLCGHSPIKLVSDNRLTRKIYGIITNELHSGEQYPFVLLYPPGIQKETDKTNYPFTLSFKKSLPSSPGATKIAQVFVKAASEVGLKTVVFVSTVTSTETQAINISRTQTLFQDLPNSDLARLHIELGRPSVIEETGKANVTPHHGHLTRLEQFMVEKWVLEDRVNTVVATPTLADGMNLPFDFSIVTYLKQSGLSGQPLSTREIMNMIGRAGRAGYVSDGIGLLVRKNNNSARYLLDASRRYFFSQITPSSDKVGLSQLLINSIKADVGDPNWLLELGGLEFSEFQSLLNFILPTIAEIEKVEDTIQIQMQSYPSIKRLTETEINNAIKVLGELGRNIWQELVNDEPALSVSLERTGLPIEVIRYFLMEIRAIDPVKMRIFGEQGQVIWADQIVKNALERCVSRRWYQHWLKDEFDLDRVFSVISAWRLGSPIASLEGIWQSGKSEKKTRLSLGKFLNQILTLFTQFWGALDVCYDEIYKGDKSEFSLLLQRMPIFTREGVSSILQLNWFYEIGKLDRVLAHELSRIWQLMDRPQESRQYIRDQIKRWALEQEPIPQQFSGDYLIAFKAIIGEIDTY